MWMVVFFKPNLKWINELNIDNIFELDFKIVVDSILYKLWIIAY